MTTATKGSFFPALSELTKVSSEFEDRVTQVRDWLVRKVQESDRDKREIAAGRTVTYTLDLLCPWDTLNEVARRINESPEWLVVTGGPALGPFTLAVSKKPAPTPPVTLDCMGR